MTKITIPTEYEKHVVKINGALHALFVPPPKEWVLLIRDGQPGAPTTVFCSGSKPTEDHVKLLDGVEVMLTEHILQTHCAYCGHYTE